MLDFEDAVKLLFNEQLLRKSRLVRRFIRKFPIPSIFLVLTGFSLGCYVFSYRLESYREQAQLSKEAYEQNIKLRDSVIQLYMPYRGKSADNTIQNLIAMIDKSKVLEDRHNTANAPKDMKEVIAGDPDPTPEKINKTDEAVETEASPEAESPVVPLVKDKQEIGHVSAQALAACVLMAANTYHVPPAVLIGILHVEGGHVGDQTHLKDGSDALGAFRNNSKLLPQLASMWHVSKKNAESWLRDDGCIGAHVTAWQLRQKMEQTDSIIGGIALYHSASKKEGENYADKVIAVIDKKGLVNHDVPLFRDNGKIDNYDDSGFVRDVAEQKSVDAPMQASGFIGKLLSYLSGG